MKQHYISLGYFCSIATELECLGLRNESSPFDWLISDFEGVILAIKNRFADFVEYDYLKQNRYHHQYYLNTKYNIQFFHDFTQYATLKEQLPMVQKKYQRRIERFYKSISEPTLFVRYISDEYLVNGISKELLWIEENYDAIIALLKSFNEDNEILFIANEGVTSSKIFIHNVQKDKGDVVNRHPIVNTPSLFEVFNSFDVPEKQDNILRYKRKKFSRIVLKVKKEVTTRFQKVFLHEYIHEYQY